MVEFVEVRSKTVINKLKYRDNWYWNIYTLNPYKGCQFACNYCDAITEKYLVHENYKDFSRKIYVKVNAPETLQKETEKVERDVIAFGGVTDTYQPAERKYEITKNLLKVLLNKKFPVHLGTKSPLILRDIELLKEIQKTSWCTVTVTITTFSEELAKVFEPLAPEPEERLNLVKQLVKEGVNSGVMLTPIIPFISDSEENLKEVIKKSAEAKAKYLLHGLMTLRSNQKIRFLNLLRKKWPHLMERYKELYDGNKEPRKEYMVEINQKAFNLCKRYKIKDYIEPPNFDRELKENFEVSYSLLLLAYFYEMRGRNPYATWAYHKAAKTIEELRINIKTLHEEGKLAEIPGVGKKIKEVVTEYLEKGRIAKLEELKSKWSS